MRTFDERLKGYEPLFREYHIVEEIGKGGSSHVFRCESASGHITAIKVISIPCVDEWESMGDCDYNVKKAQAVLSRSEEFLRRTRSEYEHAQKLERSIYTVKVLEYEEKRFPLTSDDQIMGIDILIRMDWQDCDLVQRAMNLGRPFHESEILQVGHDITSALIDLHTANMKHCDVKPKNIFVSEYQGCTYKLGDFGSSHIATGNGVEILPSAGTRGFMASEALQGQPQFSSDLYSLGVVLYWMAVGSLPKSDEDAKKWEKPEGLQEEIWTIIQTACANSFDERYFSAAEMRDAIRRIYLKEDLSLKDEVPILNQPTSTTKPMKTNDFHKKSLLLAAFLCFVISFMGSFVQLLDKPLSEAEFARQYYLKYDEFEDMTSDYRFEIQTNDSLNEAYVSISAPSGYEVDWAKEIAVTLTYSGDIRSVLLGEGSVILNGFCATKTIKQVSDNKIKILLSNIQASNTGINDPKSITITGGTGMNSSGSMTNSVTSSKFVLNPSINQILFDLLGGAKSYFLMVGIALLGLTFYRYKK